jgi:hypothetical protein
MPRAGAAARARGRRGRAPRPSGRRASAHACCRPPPPPQPPYALPCNPMRPHAAQCVPMEQGWINRQRTGGAERRPGCSAALRRAKRACAQLAPGAQGLARRTPRRAGVAARHASGARVLGRGWGGGQGRRRHRHERQNGRGVDGKARRHGARASLRPRCATGGAAPRAEGGAPAGRGRPPWPAPRCCCAAAHRRARAAHCRGETACIEAGGGQRGAAGRGHGVWPAGSLRQEARINGRGRAGAGPGAACGARRAGRGVRGAACGGRRAGPGAGVTWDAGCRPAALLWTCGAPGEGGPRARAQAGQTKWGGACM